MVFHDVTDQRKSERKLRESESRKSAILRASLDAIVSMDHEGKVVDFNPSTLSEFLAIRRKKQLVRLCLT